MYRIDQIAKYLSKKGETKLNTPLVGLSRSLLGFGTLVTLLFNDYQTLFPINQGVRSILPEQDFFLKKLSIFKILAENFIAAKSISIFILILVIVGWRPRLTCFFHWWITFSLFASSPSVDGGDQLATILSLLLIPICLMDRRKYHWNFFDEKYPKYSKIGFFNFTVYTIIRVQVSYVYFQASTHKFYVTEWLDGTVLYYWFSNPYFGIDKDFYWINDIIFSSYFSSSLITWSVLLLEVLLLMALISDKKYRKPLFFLGVLFHFFIWLVHGLFSFFLVMTAALILYLLPLDANFNARIAQIRKRLVHFSH